MKPPILFTLTVLVLFSCTYEEKSIEKTETTEIQQEEKEQGYPWTKDATRVAIAAIHQSIKNLEKPVEQREKNFPANPNNFPFHQTKFKKFEIVGYSTTSKSPDIYEIYFQPADEIISGPSIAVEINVKTKKALQVYMKPDA